MAYLRAAIATTLLLVIGLLAFIFVSFDAEYELNTAADYFLKEDYAKANSILNKLENTLSSSQWHLDKAYVARAERQLNESNRLLQLAADNMEQIPAKGNRKKQQNLLLEIYLNQAFNAYSEQNTAQLQQILKVASENGFTQEPWVIFFTGIANFFEENYSHALADWAKPLPTVWLSPWMKKTFGGIFTSTWLSLNLARCEIELDRFVQARNYLEGQLRELNQKDYDEVYLLIGLSYIKEAQEKNPENATPYYKMAFSYFNRLPILQERYDRERQRILEALEKETLALIEDKQFSLLPFFIGIYENWHAHKALQTASDKLIHLLQETGDNVYANSQQELLNLLNRALPEGELRDSIRKYYDGLIYLAMVKGDFSQMDGYLNAEKRFRASRTTPEDLAAETYVMIWELLTLDGSSLSFTSNYFSIWKALVNDQGKRDYLAKNLQAMAEELMERGAHEEKALNIIRMSRSLAN